MVALGNFVFHFRGLIFPGILIVALLLSAPTGVPAGGESGPWVDAADVAGALVVLLGLAVRAMTIGYEYIVRGGRGRQVYADNLVQGGVYAHTRNPMYLGNGLVMVGLALVVDAPMFYVVALPIMVFMYASIIAAEEAYLRDKFGAEFDAYCARVNRILPRLSGFRQSIEGMRFNWRRVLVKDYITIFLAIVGVVVLDWWYDYGNRFLTLSTPRRDVTMALLAAWLLLFLVVWTLKKTRRIEADRGADQPRSA